MANWIHRTTYEYKKSEDPPIADQTNWLKLGSNNPTSITGSADSRDWEVVGETVQLKIETQRLLYKKINKISIINARTTQLTSEGFEYGTEIFSLSAEAQRNLQDLRASAGEISWPLEIENIDDTVKVSLANASEGLTFYQTAFTTVRNYRASGKTLKDQVRAAISIAEVNAIIDNR